LSPTIPRITSPPGRQDDQECREIADGDLLQNAGELQAIVKGDERKRPGGKYQQVDEHAAGRSEATVAARAEQSGVVFAALHARPSSAIETPTMKEEEGKITSAKVSHSTLRARAAGGRLRANWPFTRIIRRWSLRERRRWTGAFRDAAGDEVPELLLEWIHSCDMVQNKRLFASKARVRRACHRSFRDRLCA
jgi:hypothetical protein